jgi:hypothetical protein
LLRFQNSRRPARNFLAGREQRRLLPWVLVTGIAFIVLTEALRSGGLAFRIQGVDGEQLAAAAPPPPTPSTNLVDAPLLEGLRPELLQGLVDDQRATEREAFLHVLTVLQSASDEALQRASIGAPSYAQLAQQPRTYRGRVVRLSGRVRGIDKRPAPQNSDGIGDYYHLRFQPRGTPNEVISIICLSVTEGFPTTGLIDEPAEFDAVFLKRWAYQAVDGTSRTGPLLVARSPYWSARPTATAPAARPWSPAQVLGTSLTIAAVGLGFVLWRTGALTPRKKPIAASLFAGWDKPPPPLGAALNLRPRPESGSESAEDRARDSG